MIFVNVLSVLTGWRMVEPNNSVFPLYCLCVPVLPLLVSYSSGEWGAPAEIKIFFTFATLLPLRILWSKIGDTTAMTGGSPWTSFIFGEYSSVCSFTKTRNKNQTLFAWLVTRSQLQPQVARGLLGAPILGPAPSRISSDQERSQVQQSQGPSCWGPQGASSQVKARI